MSTEAGRSGGLLASLRRAGATVVEIVYTRLELLTTEFEEERARVARALWLAAIGALCLATCAVLVVVFIVVLFWDTYRLQAIGVLAGGFGVAGIFTLLALRKLMTERRHMFEQSLAELRADHDRLSE